MITSRLILLLALLTATAFTQVYNVESLTPLTVTLAAPSVNLTPLQITLNNYFGCAKWTGTACQKCSQNYYFNNDGICCEVSPQCQHFNQDVGICEQCYTGYGLNNGTCKIIPSNQQTNPACLTWAKDTCTQCSVRFYNNSQGTCVPVSDSCRTWNKLTGACLTCYGGYILNSQSQCILDPQPFTPATSSLCANWNGDICLTCGLRAYFDSDGVCQPVNNYCNTWDPQTGNCYTCYPGFVLINGQCQLAPTISPADIGCKIWNWDQQLCLACSQNWVFNLNNVCVPVSDFCLTSNAQGQCLTCYNGYDLTAGACLLSPSNTRATSDLGCQNWDWNNNKCLQCSKWFVFGANGVCQAVSSLCRAYLDTTGACTSCYAGYTLDLSGVCTPTNPAPVADSGCQSWNWTAQVCLVCSKNWVLVNNTCVPVSDQCLTWDKDTGICFTCYKGYILLNGACLIQDLSLVNPPDKGCQDWNWDALLCLTCSQRWYPNSAGDCVPVSDLCKTNDPNGNCLTCYLGYNAVNGVCQLAPIITPKDAACKSWDWNNQVCLACSSGYTFNNNNVCGAVSDQCKSYNSTSGLCLTCFKGYDLVDGNCVSSTFNNAKPADSGCAKWDWDNQVCLTCSKDWVFNAQGVCTPTSDQCATSNPSGLCTSCFKGYDLINGVCIFSPSNNAHPSDLGCGNWDWNNQVCLACSKGYTFNSNKVCTPVSDQCSTYNNSNGECLSCSKGYDLINGNCVFSTSNNAKPADLGCKTWDWDNQVCSACSNKYTFNANKVCTPISDLCNFYNVSSGKCQSCFKGYDLINGNCVYSAFNTITPKDSGCQIWDWNNQLCLSCSKGYSFNNNKVCIPVSTQCRTYDSNGQCTSCFKGYDLLSGICIFSASNTAGPADLGCAKWDWDHQVCLACSNGYTFNINNECIPVSDHCKSYDSNSGLCLTCFKGYDLVDGNCVSSTFNNAKPADSGCAKWDWDNQVCLTCSKDWVFNAQGVCTPISDQCATSNPSGLCTSCFKGYDLINGVCIFSPSNNAHPSDLGCGNWDWNNQVCLACSKGYTFNNNNVCTPVSDQCSTYNNSNGECLSCFKGYDLINGNCVFSTSNNAKPVDFGCKTWDWDNQVCSACSNGYTFNSNKVCTVVSDQCKSYDSNSGLCLTCFKGYSLVDGNCVSSTFNNAKPADSGCAKWDWDNQVCLTCSKDWVFNAQGVCTPTSDQCATSNPSGLCTSCFKGYDLINGVCIFSPSNNAHPSDLGCGNWDWNNQVCLACSKGYTFNSNKVCTPVSDQCNTYDTVTGLCLSCFKGYDLVNGLCVFSSFNNAQPSDLGCGNWDWNNQVCLACSKGYTFNNNNVCTPVSDQCNTYNNSNGECLSCFKGYDLINGKCVFSTSNNAKPVDLGCGKWDWNNQICLSCSSGFVFNSRNICTPVSDQCKTYDPQTGLCASCFKGYDLINGVCTFSSFNSAKPADLGCAKWDWDNQVCQQCSKRWVFNSKNQCTPVSDDCSSYDSVSGNCTGCFPGYLLSDGQCKMSNPICKSTDANGNCLTCYTGFVAVSNDCIQISTLATLYQYYTACCPQKLQELMSGKATAKP